MELGIRLSFIKTSEFRGGLNPPTPSVRYCHLVPSHFIWTLPGFRSSAITILCPSQPYRKLIHISCTVDSPSTKNNSRISYVRICITIHHLQKLHRMLPLQPQAHTQASVRHFVITDVQRIETEYVKTSGGVPCKQNFLTGGELFHKCKL
jgi:hypothetical protein